MANKTVFETTFTPETAFRRLLIILDDLRIECPWDRKQTNESLRSLTIEETYELADAILDNDPKSIKEEIGDILLHLLFYAKIGTEKGQFTVTDAINSVCEKLIHRHPHIYGDISVADEEEVKRNWEQLKLKEGKKSILEGVPRSLPAMVKAFRIQEKAKQVGFEWETADQVWLKVQEELEEFRETLALQETQAKREEEFGDLLFALVNYARFVNIDPETALEMTNRKFIRRFQYIEDNAPKSLSEMSLEEMDGLWNEVKRKERENEKEV